MAPRCSWDRLLHRALQVRFLRRLAVQLAHGRARLQSVLAVDHDLLVSLQAGIDQRLPVTDLRYRDQAHFTFSSAPMTQTYEPFGPCCTAEAGIVRPSCRVSKRSRALTSSPGHSWRFVLGKLARSRMVPVV